MKLVSCLILVAALLGVCQAGFLPVRQARPTQQPSPQCAPVTVFNTVSVTTVVTVTDIPPTVTILQQDPASVASSMASVDTEQIIEQSELAPISNQPVSTTPVFTHSVLVSGFEATELPNDGASVFYMSKGPSTTDWSFHPSRSIVAEVTTVTVLPFPKGPATTQRQDVSVTGPAAFTSPSRGWNATDANATVWGPGTQALGTAPLGTDPVIHNSSLTTATTNVIITVTQNVTVAPGASPTSDYVPPAYGLGPNYPPYVDGGDDIEKRQTCVWISATIGGQEVGWCNNWAGQSTLTFTSWETTTTPSFIPGIGPIGTPSAAMTESSQPSTTEQLPTPSLSPTPTPCGQVGPFQIGFDDLPVFDPADNSTADFPPIFNPYDHFFWGDGWAFVPPPNEPFPPQAGTRLAEFIPSLPGNLTGSPDAGLIPPSSFGCGPRAYDNRYWFSARSAYVGCDNGALDLTSTCDFVATAYQWDNTTQGEVVVATQHFSIPPCPNFENCQLAKINFNYLFYKMTTLSFYANVQGKVSIFWLDSLSLSWYNNTCEAGLARLSARNARP